MERVRLGVSPIGGDRMTDRMVTWLVLPFAGGVELAAHGYMLLVAGYMYLIVVIPIYVFGWILLPSILDGLRAGPAMLVANHALFVTAFAVLLGFAEFGFLRSLNGEIYALLTGLPAAI